MARTPEERRAGNAAAQRRWRDAHPRAAKGHDKKCNGRRRQKGLGWSPSSKRAELVAMTAAAAGYSIIGTQALAHPRFIWIDRNGRRHVEYLETEEQLLKKLATAAKIGLQL